MLSVTTIINVCTVFSSIVSLSYVTPVRLSTLSTRKYFSWTKFSELVTDHYDLSFHHIWSYKTHLFLEVSNRFISSINQWKDHLVSIWNETSIHHNCIIHHCPCVLLLYWSILLDIFDDGSFLNLELYFFFMATSTFYFVQSE